MGLLYSIALLIVSKNISAQYIGAITFIDHLFNLIALIIEDRGMFGQNGSIAIVEDHLSFMLIGMVGICLPTDQRTIAVIMSHLAFFAGVIVLINILIQERALGVEVSFFA